MARYISLILIALASISSRSQEVARGKADTLRILFYNTENLYDPFNDTLKMDDDFLPGEPRAWGYQKFKKKINRIARAIILSGRWNQAALIGLCEIENRFVLNKLVKDSPLKKAGYQIIHYESPDPRGVDVALLYDSSRFKPVYSRAISMENPADPGFKTRDILYAKGLVFNKDTLHVFVNHWPSKYGGIASSLEKRRFVAKKIRLVIDSLLFINPDNNLLLMGDFNDEANTEVMTLYLGAGPDTRSPENNPLINLTFRYQGNKGSHKFRGEWSIIDHFIVSKNLLQGKLKISPESPVICDENMLLETDENYSGSKPFRTYSGPRYLGGYSDHLPVRVDLIK